MSNNKETQIKIVIESWKEIQAAASKMLEAYYAYDDMDNIQPSSTQRCLPLSVDEWVCEIGGLIEDWEKVK